MSLILRSLATQATRFTPPALSQFSCPMKQTASLAGQVAKKHIHIPPKDQPIFRKPPSERYKLPLLVDLADQYFSSGNYVGTIRVCDKILQAQPNNEEANYLRQQAQKAKTDGSLPEF